jgi:hypothetical protein
MTATEEEAIVADCVAGTSPDHLGETGKAFSVVQRRVAR